MTVGSNIRKRRYELGMSQQELAYALGYKTRSTIAKIESGENDVSQKKLLKFAEVLGVSAEYLISGSETSGLVSFPQVSALHTGRRRHAAVILAGGKVGIQGNIPSQFIHVLGKPILAYCLEVYQDHPSIDDIYIVCLKGWESIVKDYAAQYSITKLRGIIPGGASGAASLKNALDRMADKYSEDDLMVIQESTRPLVRAETISALLQACEEQGSATICHSMNDYVQFDISGGAAKYVDRNSMIALQSPEAHRFGLVHEVFARAEEREHPLSETCCTMLMYHLGYSINFLQSNINNVKIARNEDIAAFSAQIHG